MADQMAPQEWFNLFDLQSLFSLYDLHMAPQEWLCSFLFLCSRSNPFAPACHNQEAQKDLEQATKQIKSKREGSLKWK